MIFFHGHRFAIFAFVFLVSSCRNGEATDDYIINFEGKDFVCALEEGYEYHHVLECYSSDRYKLIMSYAGEVKHGPLNIYFPNDSLYIEAKNVNGKLEGEWKEYSETGKLKSYSYLVDNIEFYSKSLDTARNEFVGKLPVEMSVNRLADSTELYFKLLYSNLDVFYTGATFEYRLDQNRIVRFNTSSETNNLKLKLPRTFNGEIDIAFIELDTGYLFQAGEEMTVLVDSAHTDIKLIGNITSDEGNLEILKSHLRKGRK